MCVSDCIVLVTTTATSTATATATATATVTVTVTVMCCDIALTAYCVGQPSAVVRDGMIIVWYTRQVALIDSIVGLDD